MDEIDPNYLNYAPGMASLASGAPCPSCQNCGNLTKTTMWNESGSALDFSHGFYSWWCQLCIAERQLEYAVDIAKTIPDLEQKVHDLING